MVEQQTKCGTVALVGAPNAGKSTLLNAIVGQKIAPTSKRPQTTRRQLRGVYTRDQVQLIFVDTPGMLQPGYELQGYMQHQAESALMGVDAVVWVVDAVQAQRPSHQQAWEPVMKTMSQVLAEGTPVFLVLNKIDSLRDKGALLPLIESWQKRLSFTAIVPLSALHHTGVDELLRLLAVDMPEGPFIFDPDLLTDTSERELVAELVREKAMRLLGDEIPYQVAVTIEEFDESKRQDTQKPIVHIGAVIHVERESQKAIVIGKQGSKLKMLGSTARQDIQNLLGCQVMLKLFVRVEQEWSKSTKALRKLGYQ